MKSIEALILEIDHEWTLPIEEKVHLKILGAGALLLQVGYGGGTKDSDILETASLTPEIKAHLLELAGPTPSSPRDIGRMWRSSAAAFRSSGRTQCGIRKRR